MLVSKLSTRYPWANPAQWLVFTNVPQSEIDPLFASRLAALAKEMGEIIHVTGNGGKRSDIDQIRAYVASGGNKDEHGVWTGGNGLAALPGTSTHELGLAIDAADHWLKDIDKTQATAKQNILLTFGLFKPLTVGNNKTPTEDWHIQPIETAGLTVEQRKLFAPKIAPGTIIDFQKKYKLTPDGIYGAMTHEKLVEVYK